MGASVAGRALAAVRRYRGAMLRLIGIVISSGLADSLNPSTLAPALYLASGKHARVRIIEFTIGVFGVSLLGGAAIALGPGQLLLGLVPHPRPIVSYWIEIAAGAVLIIVGLLLWRHRHTLAGRELMSGHGTVRRSSLMLGAGIMAVELPTAFPYFAAIAAVVGSGRAITSQILLIALYNVCFVAPLVLIVVLLSLAPQRSTELLIRARQLIQRRWALVLAVLLVFAGCICIALGATGAASHIHDGFGHFAKRIHHLIT